MNRVFLFRRLLFAFCTLATGYATAQPPVTVAANELKAAYLYNFAMFTTWPNEQPLQAGALNFCIYADEGQTASISALQARRIRERNIQIRSVLSPEQTSGCHVLFISSKRGDEVLRLLDAVRDSSTLTVTDTLDVARKSAVISMALDNDRLAFDVNLQGARRARLILSSKLLKLARSAN
jgi:hypothetical protein